ncbi:Fumarate reductase/succinate dehydrogenase flavoprotein domain protein OS=Tsukamurella paurometabola(strain ATCC 8368 / DSM / CCUG 35730 / CIP 100753 /JCM 10117 / KCTC 9821 / NBRC 16120 / NCIMB 702349 / NCTC 13040)OX=521096 GN=Tpau_3994 PE=4 SV=1 [Tsukamurella paurometabola]|uniref:Fumarate reductase/succinate dehydrogenase flavoprotein domain protein n=1 Tax=Tsukamurella paurometabola (strain ATCC 8368 / DSM 20162 / CCUG 35730 / CIP 100753 / JCM 10117 / KCTC 9821 / NBRC 16120 / NCIMB 702349 / NCTC 13040) TaxID=521096 RepID=D5UN70_TSUPD|nr:fumarate reductase/succinate dehydrogenase flavoprotein domain protein [Tsukamurella paurometabola DSM 20162]SUP40114.1 KsdD-like steroid dehydrogenase MSMEG_5835 [Tsukamurella paurometabola]
MEAQHTGPDGFDPDAIVVGAGLAGLVAAYELSRAGRRVLILDQENRNNLGGQAFWSLGGLFLVDSPEQRRLGIKDSKELALQDWFGSAGFDRDDQDHWPRQWARAYVDFATHRKRDYLRRLGLGFTPVVGWAERGGGAADGHGNSVPRFHLTWGTGPEVVRVFREPVERAEAHGLIRFAFRHRVDELLREDDGAVTGVRGALLAETDLERGVASNRDVVGDFEYRAPAVLVTSGGIGHNFDLMKKYWPTERLGAFPQHMIAGVPAHVDGRMLDISEAAGANIVNRDRVWAYTEGIHNWDPIWPQHAIRIIPGPSSLWFDANGNRFAAPNFPGFDTNSTMKAILETGFDYSWFVLTETIIEKEFALSGSEQNPDITEKDLKLALGRVKSKGAPGPVEAFKQHGEDFIVADTLDELVAGMNRIGRGGHIDVGRLREQIVARDREVANGFSKDAQLQAVHNARNYLGDKVVRVAKPHRILDPEHGPLIAVRLNILSRKTLGGLETDLSARVLGADGAPVPGLYAAGEVAGFGGGGVHGYNALEGTFLGGCIFSGMTAGRAAAAAIGDPTEGQKA